MYNIMAFLSKPLASSYSSVRIGKFILSFSAGLVADPIIEAIAMLEFEDALRTGVLPGGC